MIERYGEFIEYDLHAYLHIDLIDFFRGRHSWGKLWSLISQLPWDSSYKRAISDDDDLAEVMLTEDKPEISLQQWDHFAELRASIIDALMVVTKTIIAVNTPKGHHVPDIPTTPRPETAVDRLLRRQRDEAMIELENLVTRPRDK